MYLPHRWSVSALNPALLSVYLLCYQQVGLVYCSRFSLTNHRIIALHPDWLRMGTFVIIVLIPSGIQLVAADSFAWCTTSYPENRNIPTTEYVKIISRNSHHIQFGKIHRHCRLFLNIRHCKILAESSTDKICGFSGWTLNLKFIDSLIAYSKSADFILQKLSGSV